MGLDYQFFPRQAFFFFSFFLSGITAVLFRVLDSSRCLCASLFDSSTLSPGMTILFLSLFLVFTETVFDFFCAMGLVWLIEWVCL